MIKSIFVAAALTLLATLAIGARAEAQPLDTNGNSVTVIGARPPGCPFRYCACGLRKFLGLDDVRLNLAANFGRFFRRVPSPAPHMVAVRKGGGHVMLLLNHVSGNVWMVRDYNGGRHLSWIHPRSIAGFYFVDPSSKVAMR